MSYCINPSCLQRQNPDDEKCCQTCGTKLFIRDERYRLVRPLRQLDDSYCTEIFEVEDLEEQETPKVLKILKSDGESPKLVELFKQEAKILIDLKHPGIPQAELDAYFTFLTSSGQKLRCLVMEKIEGQDLADWVKHNGSISQEQAGEWLEQLVKILALVHQNNLFHRDIKPSNIMRRPNGQMVLIDFGVARRVSQTVVNGQNVTVVYSHGYTAPEQEKGHAVPQSDFFALGRTFVYLLTGQPPHDLPEIAKTDQLVWQDRAPHISQQLADLIDWLMTREPKDRPQDAKAILRRLDKIRPSNSRNKWKWLIAGLVSGVVGAILSWLITQPKEALCFKDVSNVPKGIFNYGGSTSWAPIRQLLAPEIQRALPDFVLRYEQSDSAEGTAGSVTGMQMLLAGQLNILQSSRPLENENEQAQKQGFSLIQEPVALDAIAIAVNPKLSVRGLTKDQLKNIYSGKIRNWQQVGGPDLAITPYSRLPQDSGTARWFRYIVLNNQDFGNNVKFVHDTTQGLRQIATALGGVYYASAPEVVPQCTTRPLPVGLQQEQFVPPYQDPLVPSEFCPQKKNQVNQEVFRNGQYPLTRNLFVIFKAFKNENDEEKAGRAYANLLLTDQGQKLIEKAGFVRIRFSKGVCSLP